MSLIFVTNNLNKQSCRNCNLSAKHLALMKYYCTNNPIVTSEQLDEMIIHITDQLHCDYHVSVSEKCVRTHLIRLSKEFRKRIVQKQRGVNQKIFLKNNTISKEHVELMEYYINNNPVVTSEQLNEMTIHISDQIQSEYQVSVSAECVRKHLIRLSGERRKSLKVKKQSHNELWV